MVAGHLQLKRGYWYAVLNFKDEIGKRKTKWIATHLTEKGNKRRAEEVLLTLRREYTGLEGIRRNSRGIHFDEYMMSWLKNMEDKVAPTTFNGYKNIVQNSICPYFRERGILLYDLKPIHIEEYYEELLERGISNNTIIRHHANIHKALKEPYPQAADISFEEQINNRKADYYEALRLSSDNWHERQNSYFPFIENFITTLLYCYKEVDKRFAVVNAKKVTKQQRIEATVLGSLLPISKQEVCYVLPDVSPTTVEAVLADMVRKDLVEKVGSGRNTKYIKR